MAKTPTSTPAAPRASHSKKASGATSAGDAPATPVVSKPVRSEKQVVSTADLARHLDLSEWTVSRAINGHPEVKAATRKRVLEAMAELGFQPNLHARGLNGKATGIVGICFGNPRNSLVIDKIATLEEYLRLHHLRGILAINPHDVESELRIISDFRHLRVDGMVLIHSYLAGSQLDKALRGMKCVLVDSGHRSTDFPGIHLNRIRAGRFLVDHLCSLGHRSFATLGYSNSNRWRWDGIVTALHCNHLNPDKPEVLRAYELPSPGEEAYGEGIKLVKMALADKNPPTAFLAVNDRVAVGAIQGLRDNGYEVPRDFSVTGFDNLEVSRHLRPTITTIDQQPRMAMERAGEMLLTQLGLSTNQLENLLLEPIFHARESTGPAPERY
ncbi:MAG: LacI family DNA-binding transcriptional regulator [Candidatus Methylacidiphilales bacterium]|nr:LacI family DNA-binding transcriptional regulator [Candidatus Methylacidiphilales bacterium]